MNKFNLNIWRSKPVKFLRDSAIQIRTNIYQLRNATNINKNDIFCNLKAKTQLSKVIKVRTTCNFLWLFFPLLEQVITPTKNYELIFNLYDKKFFFYLVFL